MGSATEQAHGPHPSPADSGEESAVELAAALRAAAARGAQLCGGAVLLFAGEENPQLRAAAGLPSPERAKQAAASIDHEVREVARTGVAQRRPDGFPSDPARRSLALLPLQAAGSTIGVLAATVAQGENGTNSAALELLADAVALRLHQAGLQRELETLRRHAHDAEHHLDQKNDEMLKLSETLFAQDVELIRSHEQLGKAERLKNDFIEKMSRELRTPLNGMIESIIAVLAGENEALSESSRNSLRAALDDGTGFLRTLQNILELWRAKQGELPVEIQDVNFREVVEEAIFSILDTLDDKPIAIEKRFEEPFPNLRTDLAKINQILFLLLENAAKFTAKGKIEISARITDGHLVCSVRDTGIGICPDDEQFIFDEFYQVDALSATGYRGSGLGLALLRNLLSLLGGEVSVSSDVGRGSCFTFQVPVQPIQRPASTGGGPDSPRGS